MLLLNLVNRFWLKKIIQSFQEKTWPRVQEKYRQLITWCLHRPVWMLMGTVGIFIFSIIMLGIRNGGVSFFPTADPNFVFVYTSLPCRN
jgi:multidrug efflux pump subunit AcrB